MAKVKATAVQTAEPVDPTPVATKTDEAPKPPHRFFQATLPNGEIIQKRSRMNEYCNVIVVEHEKGKFGIWRWTSQGKSVNSQKSLAAKSDDKCIAVHVLEVTEVEALMPSIEQVYESKKAAGQAAKLRGLKVGDIEECEGGYRVKQS